MAVVFGSIIAGLILGLIPYFVAKSRNRKTMGIVCLVLCIIGSFIAGITLSIPICVASVIVVLIVSRK